MVTTRPRRRNVCGYAGATVNDEGEEDDDLYDPRSFVPIQTSMKMSPVVDNDEMMSDILKEYNASLSSPTIITDLPPLPPIGQDLLKPEYHWVTHLTKTH